MELPKTDSLEEQIMYWAGQNPDKPAIICNNQTITYSELVQKTILSANHLTQTFQVNKGDKMILAATKEPGFIYVYLAAHILGVVAIPLDPDASSQRLELIIEKTNPRIILGRIEHSVADFSDFENLEGNPESLLRNFSSGDDIADILFTSGTTGQPKGVVLTHTNIFHTAKNINTFIGNTKDDIELLALPISHSFGLGRLKCNLMAGSTLVLFGSFANVKKFFAAIAEFKVTGIGMVPASWAYVYKFSKSRIAEFAQQLRYIELGSSSMPLENKKALVDFLPNTRICMHYGLTEASRSTFIEFHSEWEKINSIGKPSPNVQVDIVDENGVKLDVLQEGEICIHGKNVMKGYWADYLQDPSRRPLEFFKTGDFGFKDEDGYIYLKGRKDEMINVGGKKVSPLEIEDVLNTIPGIADCACIGIPDPEGVLGQVVLAFIVVEDESVNFDEVNSNLLSRLEPYKCPVEYRIIPEVPKTSSGKKERIKLRNGIMG